MARPSKPKGLKLAFRVVVDVGSWSKLKRELVRIGFMREDQDAQDFLDVLQLEDVDGSKHGGGFLYESTFEETVE